MSKQSEDLQFVKELIKKNNASIYDIGKQTGINYSSINMSLKQSDIKAGRLRSILKYFGYELVIRKTEKK